ncbi:MAG TPA: pyridoxamine 5'-phosphate oxidase family protein [Candidatus Limnocylindria bacterium]|nr:pyridoxamine 5'-phosphate oxidase family protein [Candidatus Limnocylindria bacterium]
MDKKSFILDFISQQSLATVSTVTPDGKPEAAVIGFGQTKDLEIIFGTDNSTRKYQNLQTNPSVALVIGWSKGQTVQLEGEATELASGDLQLVKDNYWAKSPDAQKFHANPGQRYFIVRPTWARYTDLSQDPWKIIELKF